MQLISTAEWHQLLDATAVGIIMSELSWMIAATPRRPLVETRRPNAVGPAVSPAETWSAWWHRQPRQVMKQRRDARHRNAVLVERIYVERLSVSWPFLTETEFLKLMTVFAYR